MRALFVLTLLTTLVLPPVAIAEVQTFTATHTYLLGDHDSKDDARQRCLLEAKRKILALRPGEWVMFTYFPIGSSMHVRTLRRRYSSWRSP
jgi:hypothetical protein